MNLLEKIQAEAKKLLASSDIKTSDLVKFLKTIEVSNSDIEEYSLADPKHPYGRCVLLNEPRLEVMLATWTRNLPCVPHEHGGSKSAIRVLKGQSHHQLFKIKNQLLIEVFSEKRAQNDILTCAPKQVHAMGDDGLEDPLVTLHAYSGSIPDMVVYDKKNTLVVKGKCGAWIPEDEQDIVFRKTGHFLREDLDLINS
jgi:hypothetical protein